MDKNNQNKSPNENYLRILLEPIGTLSDSKVLTIPEEKLSSLGIKNHVVAGVTWTSDGHPISYGTFSSDESSLLINQIKTILSAAIVNTEQRKAVEALIEDVIRSRQFEMTRWVHRRTEEVYNSSEKQAGDNGYLLSEKSY